MQAHTSTELIKEICGAIRFVTVAVMRQGITNISPQTDTNLALQAMPT